MLKYKKIDQRRNKEVRQMQKVDKKNKKDNEEKDFAHVVISWGIGI